MGITTGVTPFPKQTVSDSEKRSKKYGLEVAQAIANEWWRKEGIGQNVGRFRQTREEYHRLRLYARGEQSVQKYRDEVAINDDLSYLNLDWKPVPIIPKFVDIVVNGMQDRLFNITATAIDPIATDKRTKFVEGVQRDMEIKDFIADVSNLGVDIRNVPDDDLPETSEELDLYMQISYKQGIEVAIEQAVDNVMKRNKYHEIKRQCDYDQMILGISCVKHGFNNTDGITIQYVDPADLVYSYTEDPYFRDVYYFGEIRRVHANELNKQFPEFSNAKLEEIIKKGTNTLDYNSSYYDREDDYDSNTLQVMYFCWKTWENDVYKIKETTSGGKKAVKKDDTFNPPKDKRAHFERVAEANEVIYEGAYILGSEELLMWKRAENMVKPDSNSNKVLMNYIVAAPRLYKGKIESLVERMTPFADLIQLTHLKLQQSIQRMTPSGVFLNADALAEIDLGNGTQYNPQEALNMYFSTGSVIGRGMTQDGDPATSLPVTPLPGSGGEQMQALVGAYNHYIQQIQEITGLNSARDGSDPDPYALVGVQKLAAANSNTATRHLNEASISVTTTLSEAIVSRFKDVLEYHPERDSFISSIGRFSVGSLKEIKNVHLHDFGIFLELSPDEEEKQYVEANIQAALAKDSITLEDAIDIRQIANIKLANQLLKIRRNKKAEDDHMKQMEVVDQQARAQGEEQRANELAKAQAESIKTESKGKLEQLKNELGIKKLQIEADVKKELMQYEFDLNMRLKQEDNRSAREMNREKIDGDIAKEKAKQGSSPEPEKGFESKGNDVLGGIDISGFEPT